MYNITNLLQNIACTPPLTSYENKLELGPLIRGDFYTWLELQQLAPLYVVHLPTKPMQHYPASVPCTNKLVFFQMESTYKYPQVARIQLQLLHMEEYTPSLIRQSRKGLMATAHQLIHTLYTSLGDACTQGQEAFALALAGNGN